MTRERVATVFGGTGFLGHTIVQALAAQGYTVRVPTRSPEKALDLKVMGDVGQVVPFAASVRSEASVAKALAGSTVVINLIGILTEKGQDTFQAMHVETAARIARLAHAAGVDHFIHVSALGADMGAPSRYARTKAIGEEAVHAFFPDAVILRPSLIFGPRDKFLGRFAVIARFLPFLPLLGGGQTRLQPVYVGDVAAAALACLKRPQAKGRFFALGGPKIYTFKALMELLLQTMRLERLLINVPWRLAKMKAFIFEYFPEPPFTREQVDLFKTDQVVEARSGALGQGRGIGTFEDLGLIPTALERILPEYVPLT